ncbi:glycoside hydrolase family 16 protein [Paxillus involutus ATCC 200175]|uniref:Glycoside hydrolase family 16 protein n=1 Tax=Paxillus involutus ATCC 200175 TaxID=664439 RepID=A0A0C9SU44_PAXIN|nr:glycoside hydrolase family 16 protein [Paxillus involutus ATCC 200175]
MKLSAISGALLLASFAGSAFSGAMYTKSESIIGEDFYNSFNFKAIADLTHGCVNYVDQETAVSLGLTFVIANTFFLCTNNTTVLSASSLGCNSVRIRSNNQYTTHVAVFDILHMPQGCRMWPVNILEGVNDVTPNQSTLHTSPNCIIPALGVNQLGMTIATNCDATADFNKGCAVCLSKDDNSFGPTSTRLVVDEWFPRYAMERTDDYISIWFWECSDCSAPQDVTDGAGTPSAYFPNTDCDLASHFSPNNIIINLMFCGDWAASILTMKIHLNDTWSHLSLTAELNSSLVKAAHTMIQYS